jgi:2-polyprenyl-6-hydroxyphenyl methylase/3-demethylubiquinone-9 3-methyltransferase
MYCANTVNKLLLTAAFYPLFFMSGLAIDVFRPRNPLKRFSDHKTLRGMSPVHDWKDWLGGYPYEPATPERIRSFFENPGNKTLRFKATEIGFGNNQFVFRRAEA